MTSNNTNTQEKKTDRISEQSEMSRISPEVSDAIKDLSPKQRDVIIQSIQAIRQESFSGPLPHPDILLGYENISSGFAERIMSMAEEQQRHRFECDKKLIKGTISESKRGQWMAFVIAILFLAGSITLSLFGHDWLGGIIGGGTLIALVTVFITGRKHNQKDN